jgi:PAS domain S-box-containing protein
MSNAYQLENFSDTIINLMNSTYIIFTTDEQGSIQWFNPLYKEISNFESEEILGKKYNFLNNSFHDLKFFENIWSTINSKKTWSGKIRLTNKHQKNYWTQTTVAPIIKDDVIKGFIFISYDITQQQENELKVIHSSKMIALGEMASAIGHEIKNPLAIISGKTQVTKNEFNKPNFNREKVQEGLNLIEKTTDRIAATVEGLRRYAFNDMQAPFEPVKIKDIITQTLPLCQTRLRNNSILMNMEINKLENLSIFCRQTEISQVLVILINNSFDAIQDQKDPWVTISGECNNDYIKIRVTDSGKGISQENQGKIMEQYFTTKDPNKGTGIGLTIAKKIIENHNGKIYLDTDCSNTSFVIELPLNQ